MGCGDSSVKVESNITSNLEKKQNTLPNNQKAKKENQAPSEKKISPNKEKENHIQITENYSTQKEKLANNLSLLL